MTIFNSIGEKVFDSLNEQSQNQNQNDDRVDFKRLYINLKDGDSINVKFLGHADVVEYFSHGEYSLSLYNQTCTRKNGSCAYCEAQKYAKSKGMEDWEKIYAKPRYLFAMYDLEKGKEEIRIFNASKNQAKAIFQTVSEYKEDLDSISFKFSRTGTRTDTIYALSPQLRIKDPSIQQAFDGAKGLRVSEDVFEKALIVRSREGQIKQLKELGFPVHEVFEQQAEENSFEVKEENLPF